MTDDEQEEIVSGPYCEHWADPVDCDEACGCGHPCRRHSFGDECGEDGCACKVFKTTEPKRQRSSGQYGE